VAAQAVAAALLVTAGAFGAWALQRQGLGEAAVGVLAAGVLAGIVQVHCWWRSRRRPPSRLRRAPDGELWLERDGTAVVVGMGPATRLMGPSVFLDLRGTDTEARYRHWLTPLDLPPADLRRLTLVLPRSGPQEGS
jgi:hypothetical protein